MGFRALGGPRRPGPGQGDRRDRLRRVRRARPARGGRAIARLRRDLRPEQLLLPARHAPVRGGSGHRDGPGEAPLLRGRRRRGRGGEPDDRRGAGTRRARAGHRAGAVRGGRVRLLRQPDHRFACGLPDPLGSRPAVVHDRQDDHAVHAQPARRQGRRRGRHDRVHSGRGERDHRRTPPVRGVRRPHALHTRAGVAGHPGGAGRFSGGPRRRHPCLRLRARSESGRAGRLAGRRERTMIPAKFDYTRPSSLDEAVSALASGGEDAKVIAGGQSLLPLLRLRFAYPSVLVDVGGIDSLRGGRDLGHSLEIGALTTHYELTRDPLIAVHCGLLAEAAGTIADPAVRHRGTIGGALAHADPAGDLPAVITALDATIMATGPSGTRSISPGEFFVDYLTTSLAPGEILTSIQVPKLAGWGYRYEKFHPTAQAWAMGGVAG